MPISEGTWPKNDIRRAFVAGAKWWEFHKTEFTMWNSDVRLAEEEAEKQYGDPPCNCEIKGFTVFHKPGCKYYE